MSESYQPSFNLAPTRIVVGIIRTPDGERILYPFRWGLRDRIFNARAETVSTKPAFASALAARRVAVFADGFFEWQTGDDDRRRPLFFYRADGAPLALAGLWNHEEGVRACTLVTTSAGDDLSGIHDRMPVLLERRALAGWLNPVELTHRRRDAILRPAPAGTLVHHPVDPRVGDVRNDGPALIARFDPPAEPLRLFG